MGRYIFFTKRKREKEIKLRMNLANGEIARWRDRFFLQREKEKKRFN